MTRSPTVEIKSISSAVGLNSFTLPRRKRNRDASDSSDNPQVISNPTTGWAGLGISFMKKASKKKPSSSRQRGHKTKVKKRKKAKIQSSYG
jgi:hypothetical protein